MNIFQNTTEWMRKGGSSSRPFPLLFNFSILVARITAQDQILAGYIPQLPTLTKCWHPSNKIIILTTTSSGSCSLPSFPGGSDGKESVCNAGDLGLIPGSRRSPGEGNGYPLQYSCLENPTDREAWWLHSIGSQRVGHDWATPLQFRCKSEGCSFSRLHCFQTFFQNLSSQPSISPS